MFVYWSQIRSSRPKCICHSVNCIILYFQRGHFEKWPIDPLLIFTFTLELFIDHQKVTDEFKTSYLDLDL